MAHIYYQNDPKTIDPRMTGVLCIYSFLFMRWAIAITPPNWPLLACHVCNEATQLTQLGRYTNAHFAEQKERELAQQRK